MSMKDKARSHQYDQAYDPENGLNTMPIPDIPSILTTDRYFSSWRLHSFLISCAVHVFLPLCNAQVYWSSFLLHVVISLIGYSSKVLTY